MTQANSSFREPIAIQVGWSSLFFASSTSQKSSASLAISLFRRTATSSSMVLIDDPGVLIELEWDLDVAENALDVGVWLSGRDGGRMIEGVVDPGLFPAFVLSEGSITPIPVESWWLELLSAWY